MCSIASSLRGFAVFVLFVADKKAGEATRLPDCFAAPFLAMTSEAIAQHRQSGAHERV